jgi:hypothetical protein
MRVPATVMPATVMPATVMAALGVAAMVLAPMRVPVPPITLPPATVAAGAAIAPATVAAGAATAPATVAAGAATAPAPARRSPSGAQDVLALPGGTVWAFDNDGQVVRSTGSGARWRAVFPNWRETPTALQVTGAFFPDAWALTAHEWPAPPGVTTVWRTTDGGISWHQGKSLPGMLTDYGSLVDQLVFADSEHGFAFEATAGGLGAQAARADFLWRTTDGGETWERVAATGLPWAGATLPGTFGHGCRVSDPFSLVAGPDEELVLTAGLCPAKVPGVWRSQDEGRHWAPVDIPAPRRGWPAAEAWDYPQGAEPQAGAEVSATRLFSGGRGVMAVTARPGQLLVYESQDHGASWALASSLQTGSLARPGGFAASSPSTWELPGPAGLYVTTDSGLHWHLTSSALSLPALVGSSFASGEMGIGLTNSVSGTAGLRTLDGGRTWQAVHLPAANGGAGVPLSPEVPFSTVDFATPSDGWAGGADGVEATTDGGTHWAAQLTTSSPVEELSFADAAQGWALTADRLAATYDGGRHWSYLAETPLGAFNSVQLVAPGLGVGVVCGDEGGTRVVVTRDGGTTWAPLPVPDVNDLACGPAGLSAGPANGLCFGTPETVWAVLRGATGPSGTIERSTDGGARWAPVATSTPEPTQLACEGKAQAWLGIDWMDNMSYAGDMAQTSDGGRTWSIGKLTGPASTFGPRLTAADGRRTAVMGLPEGRAAQAFWEPVQALVSPAAGEVVDLWHNGGAGCPNGFGLILTTDAGSSWSAPAATTASASPCGAAGLTYLASGPALPVAPSVSFPDADDGFVLAPAAGTRLVPKGATIPVTMALVGTRDAGRSWHLLARFSWRAA